MDLSSSVSPLRRVRGPRSAAARERPALAVRCRAWLLRPGLDRSLAEGADPTARPDLLSRARGLTTLRARRRLAANIERLVEQADAPRRPRGAAAPLDYGAIQACRALLCALARDLRAAGPVQARGAVLAERLLSDGASPVYAPSTEAALELAIRRARAALLLR